jgi:membrane-associated protease RseP (regulator of RpoE activity)
MTGAVGPFNAGISDESNWKLMRLARVQFGPLFLSDVAMAGLAKNAASRPAVRPEARASSTRDGSLSAEALLNYRVGLDYAHATVYFDIGRTVRFPDFDVVGLILRPEDDNGFSILGVADFQGKSSVPGVQPGDRLLSIDDTPVADFTLGQAWSLLQGTPGKERKLTVSREDKQFTVAARVQHFLGDAP